jgi:hypothetical protein
LREYYNIKAEAKDDASSEYSMSVNDHDQSDVVDSEMDQEGFDGEAYVSRVLERCSLEELLRTYNGVLTGLSSFIASIQSPCIPEGGTEDEEIKEIMLITG